MLLTISERFALSSLLPATGDILTLKDIRQVREDLAMTEEDRKEVQFYTEFQCPRCEAKETFPAPVKCGKCDVWMVPTGQVGCTNWEFTKDINIPDYILELITITLKMMNDSTPPTLTENLIGVYDRFVGSEKKEDKGKAEG